MSEGLAIKLFAGKPQRGCIFVRRDENSIGNAVSYGSEPLAGIRPLGLAAESFFVVAGDPQERGARAERHGNASYERLPQRLQIAARKKDARKFGQRRKLLHYPPQLNR